MSRLAQLPIVSTLLLRRGWKRCSKCGRVKPPAAYPSSKGRLRAYCKECHNKRCKLYREKRRNDPAWVAKERRRNRDKWHDLYSGNEYGNKTRKQLRSEWQERYPEKHEAQRASDHLPHPAGTAKHHWSYRMCDWKDVLVLPIRDHHLLHTGMTYDQGERLYRRNRDGAVLTTKHAHLELLKELKK